LVRNAEVEETGEWLRRRVMMMRMKKKKWYLMGAGGGIFIFHGHKCNH
jgi:hypothetical protein